MKPFLAILISIFILTACGQKNNTTNMDTEGEATEQNSPILPTPTPDKNTMETDTTTQTEVSDDDEPVGIAKTGFTAAEVAEHSTADDCWLILEGKVYEVTDFIPSHPGGKAILKWCGKDATQMFAGHPESAKAMKEKFYIGDLK